MIASFLTVGQQVLTLFLLMSVGFILGKLKLLDDRASHGMSNLMMYIVTPSMLVTAFQRSFVSTEFRSFGLALAASVGLHILLILVSRWLIIENDPFRKGIFRFCAVFSNCGFMGYPMMLSIIGSIGVYYGSAYVVTFNLFVWTYGIYLLTNRRENLRLKPLLLNPGVLGVFLAMLLYLLQIRLPDLLMVPLNHFASLNTPVPMVIVGYQLSHARFSQALQGIGAWSTMIMRLALSPLIAIGFCAVLGLRGDVAMVLIIAASTPPCAIGTMLCDKFHLDAALISSVMSVQTALSVLTMPVFVGLGQHLLG